MTVTERRDTFTPYTVGASVQPRLQSVDVVRGLVMILMAIDHVRVYAGVPAGGPDPAVFFTRWVTHFSAPVFAFLAGTSAFLLGRRLPSTGALSRYLVTRGLLLVLLELTVIRLSWTFNLNFAGYNLAGVIWMLGWCMVIMAAVVHLPIRAIAIVAVAVIVGQPVFGPISSALPSALGSPLYGHGNFSFFGLPMSVLYVIVPWIGVMAAGYVFGQLLTRPVDERDRLCLRIGLGMTAVFIVTATVVALTNDNTDMPVVFEILNQRKYPASVLFLMMTLGPAIAVMPAAERARGWLVDAIATVGHVPLFFYLLHIPVIHLLAVGVSLIREGSVSPWLFGNHPYSPPELPAGYRWSLGLLYLVWVIAIVALYFPSRWYARLRASRKHRWTSYI